VCGERHGEARDIPKSAAEKLRIGRRQSLENKNRAGRQLFVPYCDCRCWALQVQDRCHQEIERRRAEGEDRLPPSKTTIWGPRSFGFSTDKVLFTLPAKITLSGIALTLTGIAIYAVFVFSGYSKGNVKHCLLGQVEVKNDVLLQFLTVVPMSHFHSLWFTCHLVLPDISLEGTNYGAKPSLTIESTRDVPKGG